MIDPTEPPDADPLVLPTASRALTVRQEQTVEFYGDPVVAVQAEDGQIYVPVRQICELLGLAWSGQFESMQREPRLAQALRLVRVTRTTATGGIREVLALPLTLLPGWLFKIQPTRIKNPAIRGKIERYQWECYDILWRAFEQPATALADPQPLEMTASMAQVRAIGVALQQMADEVEAQGGRLSHTEQRLDKAARLLGQFQKRLDQVEARVAPGAYLTTEQQAHIATQVKALALFLTSVNPTKNHFQGIWTELFRVLSVSDSHHIPQRTYPQALEFLAAWWQTTVGQAALPAALPAAEETPPVSE
ncbi:MAG: phage antirepressor N-terminal domain-containing protein [Chloroflexota bacterium]|nr:phage antirepressor N-terminal domain-containing protein [Chloroflexota bacterium]